MRQSKSRCGSLCFFLLAVAVGEWGVFKSAQAVPEISFEARTAQTNRKQDLAYKYVLDNQGNFYRFLKRNDRKCQITNHVLNFKISAHPNDLALVYFVRDDAEGGFWGFQNLYVLNEGEDVGRECPRAQKHVILENVVKYNVVPNSHTDIVNVALSGRGKLVAWDNQKPVLMTDDSTHPIEDYRMYRRYGAEGQPFSSYVLFAIDTDGFVLKVKGNDPSHSKYDLDRRYPSLRAFLTENKLD